MIQRECGCPGCHNHEISKICIKHTNTIWFYQHSLRNFASYLSLIKFCALFFQKCCTCVYRAITFFLQPTITWSERFNDRITVYCDRRIYFETQVKLNHHHHYTSPDNSQKFRMDLFLKCRHYGIAMFHLNITVHPASEQSTSLQVCG